MSKKTMVKYYILLSIAAAALLILVSCLGSTEIEATSTFDRMFIGGVFISCCLLGISLGIKPGLIKKFQLRKNHRTNSPQAHYNTRNRKGHHPDCKSFQTHVINTKKRSICAGCTGLALGSVLSILFATFYILIPIKTPSILFFIFIGLGLILVASNYIETVIYLKNPILHLISNIFLVVGFFLVVIGAFQLTNELSIGIIGVIISFLWLDTRIQLSNWRHSMICINCNKKCKEY